MRTHGVEYARSKVRNDEVDFDFLEFAAFVLRDLAAAASASLWVLAVWLFVLYFCFSVAVPTCSTSPPSGNLVDGLPLVFNTGVVAFAR